MAASTSTSIAASWQLPPEYARHGIITGFKLFYKEKDSVGSSLSLTINDGGSYTKNITGLSIYTEYEFQVLAFTSQGDGPKSSVVVEGTKEDGKNLLTDILITNSLPLIASRMHQDLLVTASMHKHFKDVSVYVHFHAECTMYI